MPLILTSAREEMGEVDHYLVARAQALAGADVHRLNNILQVYLGASQVTGPGCHRAVRLAIDAERKLRAFVVMKELAQAESRA